MNYTKLTPQHTFLTEEFADYLRLSNSENTFSRLCFSWNPNKQKAAEAVFGYYNTLTEEESRMYEVWRDREIRIWAEYYIQGDAGQIYAFCDHRKKWVEFRCTSQAETSFYHRELHDNWDLEPETLLELEKLWTEELIK